MVKLHFIDTGAEKPRRLEPASGISLVIDASDEFITIDTTGIFDGDVIIGGSLTVNGTTTTINSVTHDIADNIIVLNEGEPGSGVITLGTTSGLEIDRGLLDNVFWVWNEATKLWDADAQWIGNVLDPTLGSHVGDRDFNDLRYILFSAPQLGGNLDINGNDITDGTNFKWDSANARLSVGTNENTATINGTTRGIGINTQSGGGNLVGFASHRHSNVAIVSPFFFGGRTRGTNATPLIVQNNDDIYNFVFGGWDGTDYAHAAIIAVEVDGTPGTDDMPGRLTFSTSPDGSQTPVEALRLDSNQDATFAGDIIIAGLVDGRDISADAATLTAHIGATGAAHGLATSSVNGFMSAGDKIILDGFVAGVSTVFGRTGSVVAVGGDYTASEITNVVAGNIAAVTVQAALNELDTEKSATGHTHVETDITDLQSYSLPGHAHVESDISDLGSYLENVSEDTTPSLGGNLSPAGFGILSGFDAVINFASIGDPTISVDGTSSDIDLKLVPKGAGSVDVAGSITLTGTVDGRDVATDGTKLDGIEASAKDDQSAAEVVNAPAGNIAAITVQAALNELDTEKAPADHDHVVLSNVTTIVDGVAVGSAVNNVRITNATIGLPPTISAVGTATDVDLSIEAKGAGLVNITNGSGVAGGFVNDALDTLDTNKAPLASPTFTGTPVVPTYTVAGVPGNVVGGIIFVSDGAAGNPVLAFNAGSGWLRCDTLAAISA